MSAVFSVTKEWRFEGDHDRDTDETIGIFTTKEKAQTLIDKLIEDYSEEDYRDKEKNAFYITQWTLDKPSLSSWTG
jgi:hypothetical protein